ncbi:MAG: hypothetical protein H7326_06665 [Bdellovibrionaceae bacterium]|nr:hypothetical protein [Pseudobdellovibrionaceae bacterium]
MKILKIISAATSDYDRDSNSSSTDMSRVPVPTGKYITGGILASTVGFGIGHGIQGRYAEKGWIFTAAEAGGLAVALVGASSCKDETDIYGTKTTKCSNGALAAVGLGVMIGFHVWEIVDAWTGARPVDDGPKAFILPNPEAPGIGVAWSF